MEISPTDFGFKLVRPEDISGTSPEESAELLFRILNNLLDPQDPKREIVLLNAAAGIFVGGKADDFSSGIELAAESIENGSAYTKLKMVIRASNGEAAILEELEQKYA
jgi:anthranilate phosphoribosyltransferase